MFFGEQGELVGGDTVVLSGGFDVSIYAAGFVGGGVVTGGFADRGNITTLREVKNGFPSSLSLRKCASTFLAFSPIVDGLLQLAADFVIRRLALQYTLRFCARALVFLLIPRSARVGVMSFGSTKGEPPTSRPASFAPSFFGISLSTVFTGHSRINACFPLSIDHDLNRLKKLCPSSNVP